MVLVFGAVSFWSCAFLRTGVVLWFEDSVEVVRVSRAESLSVEKRKAFKLFCAHTTTLNKLKIHIYLSKRKRLDSN